MFPTCTVLEYTQKVKLSPKGESYGLREFQSSCQLLPAVFALYIRYNAYPSTHAASYYHVALMPTKVSKGPAPVLT